MNDDEDDVCVISTQEACDTKRFGDEAEPLDVAPCPENPPQIQADIHGIQADSALLAAEKIQRWWRARCARRAFRSVMRDLQDYLLIEERRSRYVAPPYYASRSACAVIVRFLRRAVVRQKALREWGLRMRWLAENDRLVDFSFPKCANAEEWTRSRRLQSWSYFSAPTCPGASNPIQKWLGVTHKQRSTASRILSRMLRKLVRVFRCRDHRQRIFRELLFVTLDETDRRLEIESAAQMMLCDTRQQFICTWEELDAWMLGRSEGASRAHAAEQTRLRNEEARLREPVVAEWDEHVVLAYNGLLAIQSKLESEGRRRQALLRSMELAPLLMNAAVQASCLRKAELLSGSLKLIDDVASKGLVFLDRRTTPRIVDFFESAHYETLPATSRLCVDVDEWYIHLREEECLAWDKMLLRFSQNRLRQKLENLSYVESMAETERLQRARLVSQMLRAAPIRYAQNSATTYSTKQYLPQQPASVMQPEATPVTAKGPAPPRAKVVTRRPQSASTARTPRSSSGHVPYRLGLSAALAKAIDGARGSIRHGNPQRPASARNAADSSSRREAQADEMLVDNGEECVYI